MTPDGLIAIGQDRQTLPALQQSDRRPAHRPTCLGARWNSYWLSGASWLTPGLKPATPTASRCAQCNPASVNLVSLRRAGLHRARGTARAALRAKATRPAQNQDGGLRLHPRMR
ncbi:hypothetical protein LNP74_28715 [Klebsiella pneumoniae subsp. pneumoniae]|nr:hypothetical protein [Klebsiella pneumoniae subsp. pneumoniae]